MSYFLHRIQRANGTFSKGIEVHDTLESAILSFWGRMKLGYDKTNNDFVSCKITNEYGAIIDPYSMTWLKDGKPEDNVYFLHHIRKENDNYDKNIDTLESLDSAKGDFAEMMEYGYNNPVHPKVSLVSCFIDDLLSGGMIMMDATWKKPNEQEPEHESVD